MSNEIFPGLTVPLQQAAVRVLSAERTSRATKAGHMRKQFGERITKALEAETSQLEREVEALDIILAQLNPE